jgi:hypothetical protein
VVLLIHEQYYLARVLRAAAQQFAKEGSIQLGQFLLPEAFKKAALPLQKTAVREHYLPDQYRCHEPKTIPAAVKRLQRWLKTKEAAAIISAIVDDRVRCKESCLCVYAHRDYTVRHDKNIEPPGYDVLLDLTPRWNNRACGHHSYVNADGNELVRIPVAGNTLAIIRRPAGVQKFVKYVNHFAGKDRRIVLEARFA